MKADSNYFAIAPGNPLVQNWSDGSLISANDNWSSVPSFSGYRGDDGVVVNTDIDVRTVLADYSGIVDVQANQVVPNTLATAGVAEFAIADPTVALMANGASDFPNLDLRLNTLGCVAPNSVRISYNLRDLDGSADNAVQQIGLQYRIGPTGNYSNVPGGYTADATTGPTQATLVTPVALNLPADLLGQPQVHLRWITANAAGSDEWVGIDDINLACVAPTAAGANISGRVQDAYGRAISRAIVTLLRLDGTPKYAYTNTFGYYKFGDNPVGETYLLSVSARKYRFSDPVVFFDLNDSVTDLNFVAAR